MGHPREARADYRAALETAGVKDIAQVRKELQAFATEHPDTPGVEALLALLPAAP